MSNLRVNGQVLNQEWDGVEASGSGLITTQSVNGLGIRKLTASWKSSCIFDTVPSDGSNSYGQDAAQVLTLTVDQVDGKDIAGSGFTVSFKQIVPEVLRVSLVPVPSAGEAGSAEEWRNPPPVLRWSSPTSDETSSYTPATIEDEITQLRQLKAEAKELNRLIREKQKTIKALVKQDYASFEAEIRQCDNIRCVVKAMLHKARGAVRMACQHFEPGHHHHPQHGHHHHQHAPPPQTGADPPLTPPTDGQGSSSSYPHNHPHFLPHELEDEQHHSPLHRTLGVLTRSAIFLSVVSFFRLIFKRCRSPRRCAEYAARREERRNRRLYRRAARRQRWNNWFDWFCRRQPSSEPSSFPYDEKRALVIDQESILESAMQAEIYELRNAHEVVNNIVRAEEGRCIHELDGGMGGVRSNTLSLPDYDSRSEGGSTEPPTYEEQMAGDSVVDGFQYTPEGTRSTPASSVVDTSPRISLDSRETREFV